MFLDPAYTNLWLPFVFVCVLALVVFAVLLIMIVMDIGRIADELKRYNDNEQREIEYFSNLPPVDPDDDEGWKVDLFDEKDRV